MKQIIMVCFLIFLSAQLQAEAPQIQRSMSAALVHAGQSIKNSSCATFEYIKKHKAAFSFGAALVIIGIVVKFFHPRFPGDDPARARLKEGIGQPENFRPVPPETAFNLPGPIPDAPPARFQDLTASCVPVLTEINPDGTIAYVDEAGNLLGSQINDPQIS